MHLLDFIVPSERNNYKAYLLNNFALTIYLALLILFNIFGGGIALNKTYALLDVNQIVVAHNRERREMGLKSLTYNPKLSVSAKEKGKKMLELDCWSHYCPPGESPWNFVKDAGYDYLFAGENLAEGFSDVDAVMQAWMNSQSHRENILRQDFTEIGIAIVIGDYQGIKDNAIIVVHLGTPSLSEDATGSGNVQEVNTNNTIQITSPLSDSYINDASPAISGISDSAVNLSITNSGKTINQKSGEVLPDGGIFTYKFPNRFTDGNYNLSASNNEGNSNINFWIDNTPPAINPESLSLEGKNSQFSTEDVINSQSVTENLVQISFELPSGENIASVKLLNKTNNNNYYAELQNSKAYIVLPATELSELNTFLEAIDKAGNMSEINIGQLSKNTLQQFDNLPIISGLELANLSQLPNTGNNTNFFVIIGNFLSELSPLQLFIIIVLSALIVLILIDMYSLSKLKSKQLVSGNSKSQYHLAAFVILFVVVTMGNLGGII